MYNAGIKVSENIALRSYGNQAKFTNHQFKDVRGWQFLTIAAETLCMVCLPPEGHIFIKKYLGNRPFKKSHFVRV